MNSKKSIYNKFRERKYINKKTRQVETKITTNDTLLRKLLKDFSYDLDNILDMTFNTPSLDVNYKGLDLCDWEEAITALYMFSSEYIEDDEYYDGKYDTIIEVYKLPTGERKAIYDLFQYLEDSETKSQSDKIIFDYEKFGKEYIEIRHNKEEMSIQFMSEVDEYLLPLTMNIRKESYELSMIWCGLEGNLINEDVKAILDNCTEIQWKYKELYNHVKTVCDKIQSTTLKYKGDEL